MPPTPPPPSRKKANVARVGPAAVAAGTGSSAAQTTLFSWSCLGLSAILFVVASTVLIWELVSDIGPSTHLSASQFEEQRPTDFVAKESADNLSKGILQNIQWDTPENSSQVPVAQSSPDSATTDAAPANPTTESDPFNGLRDQHFQLALPANGAVRELEEVTLSKLPVPSGQKPDLALRNVSESKIRLQPRLERPDGALEWVVKKQVDPGTGTGNDVVLGTFIHRQGELRFQWDESTPQSAKPASLQFVPLDVRIGNRQQVCQLRKSAVVSPLAISNQQPTINEAPFSLDSCDATNAFRVEFQLRTPSNRATTTVSLGETATIAVDHNGLVEIEAKVVPDDTGSSIEVRLFGKPRQLKPGPDHMGTRQEISLDIVEEHLRQTKSRDPQKLQAEIEKYKSELEKMESATKKTGASQEKRVEAKNARIGKLEEEKEKLQSILDQNTRWCHDVDAILRSFEHQTKLHYAIYQDSQPRVRIVETSGFDWGKK